MLSGNFKLKQKDATAHLLEEIKIQVIANTKHWENTEQRECSLMAVGTQNGTATLEGGLAVSYKTKHSLTSNSHKEICKHMMTAVFFMTAKKLEATTMSFNS